MEVLSVFRDCMIRFSSVNNKTYIDNDEMVKMVRKRDPFHTYTTFANIRVNLAQFWDDR